MIETGVIQLTNDKSKTALVFGQMNEPPGARARVALTGLTIAEYFRDDEGQDVLLFIDNIFRFTQGAFSSRRARVVFECANASAFSQPVPRCLLSSAVSPRLSDTSPLSPPTWEACRSASRGFFPRPLPSPLFLNSRLL